MNGGGASLAEAFFDGPGLLGVRLGAPADDRLRAFAAGRRPDPGLGIPWTGVAAAAGFGLVAGAMLLPLLGGGDPGLPRIEAPWRAEPEAAWRGDLRSLADDLAPRRADLRPWAVRTLLDVPRQLAGRPGGDPTGGWLVPREAAEDRRAHRQAQALAAALADGGAGAAHALIIDLPGPQAVAAAAALAGIAEPVFTMDNLPHPAGVVPSDETLAAAVRWRDALVAAAATRPAQAQPCFVLDAGRLVPYANQVDRFDNRSAARLPGVDAWRAWGVERILYLRPSAGDPAELDDLNELFVELAAAGIAVDHVGLDRFADGEPAPGGGSATHPHVPGEPWPLAMRHALSAYHAARRPIALPTALDGGRSRQAEALSRLSASAQPSGGTSSRVHTRRHSS